jgi:NAD(P)-dependent dehydrogenase (short-subunit alcohol dehydrogenase family)/uncharacterized OB-fold protein
VSEPISPPKRKNPLRRARLPTAPARARSRTAHGLTQAAAQGRFALQRCTSCGAFAYPPRDACPVCLSSDLPFVDAPPDGTLLAETTIRVASDVYFRERAPWRIGIVALACGPRMIAHLHGDCEEGKSVRMSLQIDKAGGAVAFARPARETPNSADDQQWREMTADPKFRRVLVTDGRTPVGLEIVSALKRAGASIVFVGIAEPWKPFPTEAELRALDGVQLVALDVADEKSVSDLAADIGGKVDILVNTVDHVRPGGLLDSRGTADIRQGAEQSYLGLVHLAQAFGPAMRMRGADGTNSAAAWANILSIYALANCPAFGAYSATQAACLSLSQCLRAELRAGGVKVVNVFTGPTDTEWFQTLPPPKVAPRALANAVVTALRNGLEDVFVGDIAEDLRQRLIANPKAVERELAP